MLRLAVFASGHGSNLEAIYDSIVNRTLRAVELAVVISNNSHSGAIAFAQKKNILAIHLSLTQFEGNADEFQNEMLRILEHEKINLIVLAGYMKKLPDFIVEKYRGRILNVHPALLPDFGGKGMFGMNVHRSVITSERSISGATIHIVEGEYDSGKIVLQESCPVLADDTPESLANRIKKIEHKILPQAIQIVVDGLAKNS